ncbi:hypothetical protein, partial [Pseudoalteromonas rubra]|uniref:hypothetical protein n=1 Tax=Pseudoalteromonas rubra TaxID=43658 RepID=UPI00197DD29C
YVLVFHRKRPAKAVQSDSRPLCPPLGTIIEKPRISGAFLFLYHVLIYGGVIEHACGWFDDEIRPCISPQAAS